MSTESTQNHGLSDQDVWHILQLAYPDSFGTMEEDFYATAPPELLSLERVGPRMFALFVNEYLNPHADEAIGGRALKVLRLMGDAALPAIAEGSKRNPAYAISVLYLIDTDAATTLAEKIRVNSDADTLRNEMAYLLTLRDGSKKN
jgi:hypothetical protein